MERRGPAGAFFGSVGVIALGGAIALAAGSATAPKPPGRLVDLGGHRLHVRCMGKGSPTVVVENGLGDFSFDWILVQSRVARYARICTYDRAGYAWSDPGPKPRTFAQLNMELKDALSRMGEHGPYVLVGHSFGGPVVRNFAMNYPREVAGLVLVDSAQEDMRVPIQGKAIRLRDEAQGRSIPPPHEEMRDSDRPPGHAALAPPPSTSLEPLYTRLPPAEQKLHLWAQTLPEIEDAEDDQRQWSTEYFARWHRTPQAGSLGAIPVIVMSRAEGGYGNDLDIPAAELEQERRQGQAQLARLSTNSRQVIARSGHNMHLEAPEDVAAAIRDVVEAVRHHRRLEQH